MTPHDLEYLITRRQLLTRTSAGLGALAVSHLLGEPAFADRPRGTLKDFHFEPEAKRIIFLFMSGGPSHIDLFDAKPQLKEHHGKELPPSVRGEQRITLMTRGQKELLVAASPFTFKKFGQSGQEMNEHFENLGRMADDIAIIRSVFTEPINHDPAVTMMQTGMPQPGRPCIGSWVSYGLGSENKNLPDFVVLLSGQGDQPVLSRYYHSGFLPGKHQGTQFRSQGDSVLFLSDPAGMSHAMRGETVEAINKLNRERFTAIGDPEIEARINSFELAYRMQTSVPELMDIAGEPASVHERYGTKPGEATFANNCLLARRLVERGVRFVQLYHRGWDHHSNITENIPKMCGDVDKPCAALLEDLKERGLLKDTLVICGGEFGRTTYSQGDVNNKNFGRDHHPRCFSIWLAGGGIKGGVTIGKTDDFAYNIVEDPVHVRDIQATLMHQLGVDESKLTFRFQGRDQYLTNIGGKLIRKILV